jgi:hypothetical protein
MIGRVSSEDHIMPCRRLASLLTALPAALAALIGTVQSAPAERPTRLEVWDLELGTSVEQLPDAFVEYACGTNGGPPSTPLKDWREARRCRPERSGLREVYFRYDDELEYWAKAHNLPTQIAQYSGTKTYGFPIVVSALFDDGGLLRGIRLVSDPRGDMQNRDEAYLLRNFLTARFGRDGWACEKLDPEGGETAVDGIFVKERCRKDIDGQTVASLAVRHLRKPGQRSIDPHSGRETTGQFESTVRFELVARR